MKTLLLVFQLVVTIESEDRINVEQPEEIYFYSLQRCLSDAEALRDQRNRRHYRYSEGRVGAYCKTAYVFKEEKEALIWH